MNLSRRSFMGGAFAAGILSGCRSAVVRVPAGSSEPNAPKLRLGVMSDIHVYYGGDGTDNLDVALAWFRAQDVDGVVITGDLAHLGDFRELNDVGRAWDRAFPGNRGRDGRHVEKLFICGNHDFWFRAKGKPGAWAIADDPMKAWRLAFHEDFAPVWKKTVKGYTFIGASWPSKEKWSAARTTSVTPPGAVEAIEAVGAACDPKKPFFYLQHQHPEGTVFGEILKGTDDGLATAALSKFPNAVAISGHEHGPLTDERAVWQGAFTSIEAGTMRNTTILPCGDIRAYENGSGGNNDAKMMSALMTCDCAHGLLMDVYDDHLHLQRRDFFYDRPLGDDWIVPLPASASGPLNYEKRAKRAKAPEFAPDAWVTARLQKRTNRHGDARTALGLTFAAAQVTRESRAYGYEIVVRDEKGCEWARTAAVDPIYNLPKVRAIRDWVTPAVDVDGVPAGTKLAAEVRPFDCWGNRGKAIVSEPVVMSRK